MLHRYLVPEFCRVTQVLMAWADYYISMRGVAPTLVDLGRARLEYAAPHHPKTNSDHWCTLVWLMITALRRYERWYKYQKTAPWLDDNPQGFEISKGHMFDHTAAFAVLWGANDNARLDNFEKAHQKNAKHAAKRTRQHESTWMNEIEGAVDFMDAVTATVALPERRLVREARFRQ